MENFHEPVIEAPQLELILPKRTSLVIIIVANTLLQVSTGNLALPLEYSMSDSCRSSLSSHRPMSMHNISEEIRLSLG